ncbi:hypothetical protein H6G06_04425 [Anabaena sphaerica FACHB-251]|uniref:PEP-CTERM sorting domain-containing protein n=1 Tax=Anabaena sphaerica FACHB-251 TaxID=2692883 RepID=A0A926ZZS8_9NOST|nr:hypothetical protein [Anabaena sphaerica]MBD2292748.1 hypothetical protein [Anabaena sphaerica FACHB-251]
MNKILSSSLFISISSLFLMISSVKASTIVLYDQDFENPNGFVDTSGGDVSQQSVNSLYGNQPVGFSFSQRFTVETLLITGNNAFGTGYSDPTGVGGNYALGMLAGSSISGGQDDLLGLAFNVGDNDFLNVRLDISSIDLDRLRGPFLPTAGALPVFEFTLFDNPSGALGTGSGLILSSQQVSGSISDRSVFDWTEVLLALDASASTNGNVILRIDLLSGNYAAFDNLRIVASNTPGDVGKAIPEPASALACCVFGMGLLVSRIKA